MPCLWIASVLGILKSGNWFITLDPSYPRPRILSILENSEPVLIVTDDENLPLARELAMTHASLVNIDQSDSQLPDTDVCLSVSADSMACVLYTSGSTGAPKGVVLTHRPCLHQAMIYTNYLYFTPDDRIASLGSLSTAQTLSTFLRTGLVDYDIPSDGSKEV